VAFPETQQPRWNVAALTVSTAVSLTNPDGSQPTLLGAIINVDLAAQTNNVQAFDNPSAASGQAVGSCLNPTPGAGFVAPVMPGVTLLKGLTVKASGVPTGSGYIVLFR
jgi:hypothetical protein